MDSCLWGSLWAVGRECCTFPERLAVDINERRLRLGVRWYSSPSIWGNYVLKDEQQPNVLTPLNACIQKRKPSLRGGSASWIQAFNGISTPERASKCPLLMHVGTTYNHLQPLINLVLSTIRRNARERRKRVNWVLETGENLWFSSFSTLKRERGGRDGISACLYALPPLSLFPRSSIGSVIMIRSFWCSKLYQSLTFGNLRGETPRPPLTTISWFFT